MVPLPRCSSNNSAVANVFIQRKHHCNGIHHVTAPLRQRSSNKPMPMTRYSPNSRGLAEVFIQQQCTRQGVRPATLTAALTNVYKMLGHSHTLLQLAPTNTRTATTLLPLHTLAPQMQRAHNHWCTTIINNSPRRPAGARQRSLHVGGGVTHRVCIRMVNNGSGVIRWTVTGMCA